MSSARHLIGDDAILSYAEMLSFSLTMEPFRFGMTARTLEVGCQRKCDEDRQTEGG
jgi:hypothetical protein